MIAYLDNSATTKPCSAAIQAMVDCMQDAYYNPSSVYLPAVDVFRRMRDIKGSLLDSVSGSHSNVCFTSGGTEANNLAILGAVHAMHGKQLIVRTSVEHPSVAAAFDQLEREGHEVRILNVDACGAIDQQALRQALDDGASFISCMLVNNETGALLNAEQLRKLVGDRAVIHIDGVQGYLRVPFRMEYADLFTVSGHKIHGPKGIGALFIREGIRLEARQIGGGQENGWRSGTENTPGIFGFGAAVSEMRKIKNVSEALMQRKCFLVRAFREAVPELAVNGPAPEDGAPHIVNLSFPGVRGEVMLHALEAENVYASTGSACSSKKRKVSNVLLAMGIAADTAESALRFSICPYTTEEEIAYAADAIKKVYSLLRNYARR